MKYFDKFNYSIVNKKRKNNNLKMIKKRIMQGSKFWLQLRENEKEMTKVMEVNHKELKDGKLSILVLKGQNSKCVRHNKTRK